MWLTGLKIQTNPFWEQKPRSKGHNAVLRQIKCTTVLLFNSLEMIPGVLLEIFQALSLLLFCAPPPPPTPPPLHSHMELVKVLIWVCFVHQYNDFSISLGSFNAKKKFSTQIYGLSVAQCVLSVKPQKIPPYRH